MSDLVFTWPSDYTAKESRAPNLLTASFGDGYTQRMANGLNSMPRSWTLSFTRNTATCAAVERFLADRGGWDPFLWQSPRGVVVAVTCSEWGNTYDDFDNEVLSVTFNEEFDPALSDSLFGVISNPLALIG